MSPWLCEILGDLAAQRSPEAVLRALQRSLHYYFGFPLVMYQLRSSGDARVLTNMPIWWREEYQSRNLARVDPYFRYCCSSYDHTYIGERFVDNHPFLTDAERRFIIEASETKLRSGVAVPIALSDEVCVGGWSVGGEHSRRETEAIWQHHGQVLRAAMLHAHVRIETLSKKLNSGSLLAHPGKIVLSGRERDCLIGLALGLQLKEIGAKLDISYSTVELHLRNARRKLGARTREQALTRAITQRLIDAPA